MKAVLEQVIEPDEIIAPDGRGSLLPEVTMVRKLREAGRNAFSIANALHRSLRWVLDRMALSEVDPNVLAMVDPESASDLRRRIAEEYGPILEMWSAGRKA